MAMMEPEMQGAPQGAPPGLPPELAGLAQGPPPAPGGEGPPPGMEGLMSLMQEAQNAPDTDNPNLSAVDHLRQAIEHAQQALQMEPDDKDSQDLSGVLQKLYAILAARQSEQDKMLGGGNLRAIRRGAE